MTSPFYPSFPIPPEEPSTDIKSCAPWNKRIPLREASDILRDSSIPVCNGFRDCSTGVRSGIIDQTLLSILEGMTGDPFRTPTVNTTLLQDTKKRLESHNLYLDDAIKQQNSLLEALYKKKRDFDHLDQVVDSPLEKEFRTWPRIPVEIAQMITELAAESDRNTAMTLTLVSKCVQPWADRGLYKSVNLSHEHSLKAFETLATTSPQSLRITRALTCITSLVYDYSIRLVHWTQFENILNCDLIPNLQELAITKQGVFYVYTQKPFPKLKSLICMSSSFRNLQNPIYRGITRLQFIDPVATHWNFANFCLVKKLKHLRLEIRPRDWNGRGLRETVEGLIPHFPPSLLILLLVVPRDVPQCPFFHDLRQGAIDSRIVLALGHQSHASNLIHCTQAQIECPKWVLDVVAHEDQESRSLLWEEAERVISDRKDAPVQRRRKQKVPSNNQPRRSMRISSSRT